MVAAAQYTKLQELWFSVSRDNVIRPKPQYASLQDPESGILNRVASVVSLAGLVRNQRAVLQTEPAFDWIARHVDPATPLVAPLIWAVTNLTYQRPEYFYVRPGGGQELPARLTHALHVLLGEQTVVREATPDILHRAIFASIAIPIAFDPIIDAGARRHEEHVLRRRRCEQLAGRHRARGSQGRGHRLTRSSVRA